MICRVRAAPRDSSQKLSCECSTRSKGDADPSRGTHWRLAGLAHAQLLVGNCLAGGRPPWAQLTGGARPAASITRTATSSSPVPRGRATGRMWCGTDKASAPSEGSRSSLRLLLVRLRPSCGMDCETEGSYVCGDTALPTATAATLPPPPPPPPSTPTQHAASFSRSVPAGAPPGVFFALKFARNTAFSVATAIRRAPSSATHSAGAPLPAARCRRQAAARSLAALQHALQHAAACTRAPH